MGSYISTNGKGEVRNLATKRFSVVRYKIKLGDGLTIGGGQYKFPAVVSCHGADGYRCLLYFYHEGDPRAPQHYNPQYKVGTIQLSFKDIMPYIDMLRNEKPVYAYLNSDKPEWNNISTTMEPVGEEES